VSAAALLAELQVCGAQVRLSGEKLVVRIPQATLTEELIARVRQAKPALVAELRNESLPRRDPRGELVIPFGADAHFRWWEARTAVEMRRRFRLAREAAEITE
jgi:hypothetical protein